MARNPQKRAAFAYGGGVYKSGSSSANTVGEARSSGHGGAGGGKHKRFARGGCVTSHKSGSGKSGFHKKDGGPVPGLASGGRADKKARGGKVKTIQMFARGGGVGADKSPFSSAGAGYERHGPKSKGGM